MSESGRKRWVWDLYPLAKDSWGVWEVAPEMSHPHHRVYMYRMQYDGYMGPVTEQEELHKIESPRLPQKRLSQIAAERKLQAQVAPETPQPSGKIVYREAFEPRDDDFALLTRCYPGDDPHRPEWYRVKADLEAVGHDGDKLVKTEAPVLLGLLRKAKVQSVADNSCAVAACEEAKPDSTKTLKDIAAQLRAIPGDTWNRYAEDMAGRCLAEALRQGAFARIEYLRLRHFINERIEKGHYAAAFATAVGWLKDHDPTWKSANWQEGGPKARVNVGCAMLANTIENEAKVPKAERVLPPVIPGRLEAVSKAEEIQRRQENERRRGQHGILLGTLLRGHSDCASIQAPTGDENKTLALSIVRRSALWFLGFAGLECAIGFCAWNWGAGDNLWQRITQSWQWFGAVFVASALVYPFLLGRERWRWLKFWKGDDK